MIEFPTAAYEAIVAHAREGVPEEVCGVLGGKRAADRRTDGAGNEATGTDEAGRPDSITRVRSVHRAANAARSPRRTYLIDPEEQLAVMEAIEESSQEVVGFYHSHPMGPAEPSPTDERRATWTGYSYVVCLPDPPFVGSWRWGGEREGFAPEVVSLR